jgi:hypothetical protein
MMNIGFATPPPTRVIGAEGTPEAAGEPLIVNVAVESATVAVTVVLAGVFRVNTSQPMVVALNAWSSAPAETSNADRLLFHESTIANRFTVTEYVF